MRASALAVLLALMLPGAASAAPSTSPGYTALDQQQFAKLGAAVGTWTCTDTPASKVPDAYTVTQQGNWFVFRETGDQPNTMYERWSHDRQAYFANQINDSGAISILTTTSSDPYNATWKYVFPSGLPANQAVTLSFSGNTMTAVFPYSDANGNMLTGKSVCTKA